VTATSVGGMSGDYRVEHDTLGEVMVGSDNLWKAQTQRAVENFPISGTPLETEQVRALALIKQAAAKVNAELGVLPSDVASAIEEAAAAVATGEYDEHFPIDVFQTGSGTSSNMNANEVIASLASDILGADVHPNDAVNASQSSNDVFPTSIHLAAASALTNDLVPALEHLQAALQRKSTEFADIVKSGRTHLMDATPVTLGQEFGGYAAVVAMGVERIRSTMPRVGELPLGGTAVGTGINMPPGFAARVIEVLTELTGLPLTEARNHFEAQGSQDALVEASGQLRAIAVGLYKICTDLRWMGSGPRAGLGEIHLPDLQPGSSIMPGKVNPVLPEATSMVCAQVIGNDATVTFAGASGNFELNVMLPVIARNVLESIRLLTNSSRLLADRCVDGITADQDQCRRLAESSPSIVTPLNRIIGYENAAAVAKKSVQERRTIREVVIDEGYVERGDLTEEQLDRALDVLAMTRPPTS
jgi:fumarate hydratase, class II